ncbi:tyrosine-type recombinase/integrase [Phytopseudomonas daroniae]|uniref:tyrosine-type recombinase/integrase n=1 Tax=Phytopseudomonas daroniae TaxID=2487519 RepID=UPI00103855C7|nr:integrase family protein [Pseudomonas daroniae]TBU78200.1 integrase [Pseudomonas daroniae]
MLTEKQIRAFKPEEKEFTVSDGRTARGEGVLLLRVRPNGTKEFYFQRRQGNRKVKAKLGNWPAMSLTEARDQCRQQKEVVIEAGTFKDVLDTYVAKLKAEGASTAGHVEWSFKHYVLEPCPHLAKRPAAMTTPGDIRDIITMMINDGITTACNRVRSRLHAAFQHALQEEFNPRNFHVNKVKFGLLSNPVASIPVQSDWEAPGERNLSVAELSILWNLLPEHLTLTTAELLKFLIATGGQRPEQLLRSDRTLYQRDHMIIRNPKAGAGERSVHVVPLNKLAKHCLSEMDAISKDSVYPFQGKKAGQSLQAQSLSRAVTALYGRHEKLFNGPFTLRDIRRTCTTLMGAAGLDKPLRDRIQGRAFNDVGSKHYDRYDYFKEKKAGLTRWATWLDKNVITQKG